MPPLRFCSLDRRSWPVINVAQVYKFRPRGKFRNKFYRILKKNLNSVSSNAKLTPHWSCILPPFSSLLPSLAPSSCALFLSFPSAWWSKRPSRSPPPSTKRAVWLLQARCYNRGRRVKAIRGRPCLLKLQHFLHSMSLVFLRSTKKLKISKSCSKLLNIF